MQQEPNLPLKALVDGGDYVFGILLQPNTTTGQLEAHVRANGLSPEYAVAALRRAANQIEAKATELG